MRCLILVLLAVAALSLSFAVWLHVSALRGEPEWSQSWLGPPVAVSLLVACVASVLSFIRGGRRAPYPLPMAIMFAAFLCPVGQSLADWRSIQPVRGGAISGDPGDRYLHSHSVRIRAITEEEYQRYDAANWRLAGAIEVAFGMMGLGMAVQTWLVYRRIAAGAEPADALTPPAAGG